MKETSWDKDLALVAAVMVFYASIHLVLTMSSANLTAVDDETNALGENNLSPSTRSISH